MIGPKRYELPWKHLEREGFLATARCHEVRVALSDERRQRYEAASARNQIRIASDNERKNDVVGELLRNSSRATLRCASWPHTLGEPSHAPHASDSS